ncbi:hypothetical protein SAMN05443634_1076 [Chishuiella changwenlii]|uniref:Uncharacterized protein n=1 Tax=Chishuiella changwenlii TaxID=1434701 RepID=A0A1M6YS06_9FLAO|nr:APC family permease [Chishuiella changwenlii]GGE88504.1 hypothetical protein GCM10010984_02760 [Chishuiella changwenlii]SHL20863.1 hypothetical protein SAMN05443634_1076 [Chishuiella changwenlii]
MFKKLNQTLITKYPLIWNLKYIWILLAAISINIIAFINGFLFFSKRNQLQESRLFDGFTEGGTFVNYIFASIIIIIIWLYFYIKNNRFKSFYPTSRNYLFKEFLALFFLFFVFLYIPNSFKLGIKYRVANTISNEQYFKDIDIINRAQAFTLQPNFGYNNSSRNLAVPVFDSLVSEKETKQLFEQNFIAYKKQYPKAEKHFIEPYFRNPEFEILLEKHFPQRKNYQPSGFTTNHVRLNEKDPNDYDSYVAPNSYATEYVGGYIPPVEEKADSVKEYYHLESLYNYSRLAFENKNDTAKNHAYYDKELITLLQKNDRKAIETLLVDYTKLLDKNEIGYEFKKSTWLNYIPQYPYYFIDYQLGKNNSYPNGEIEKDYINQSSLNEVYNNFEKAKFQSSWLENIEYYMMFAIGFAVFLVTFRFSSFKVWLISIVGAGILSILGSVLGLGISSVFNYNNYTPYIILILFYILFIVIMSSGLRTKQYKLITGVNLNWFVATNIFIGIVLLGFYTDIRADMLYDPTSKISIYQLREENAELRLLKQIADIFIYVNPILYIISFYFIINLYKNWQAMPEE